MTLAQLHLLCAEAAHFMPSADGAAASAEQGTAADALMLSRFALQGGG